MILLRSVDPFYTQRNMCTFRRSYYTFASAWNAFPLIESMLHSRIEQASRHVQEESCESSALPHFYIATIHVAFLTICSLLLLQEALEKAYEADVVGDLQSAVKRYKVGLSAIEEGLKQEVVQNGLGPLYDNVARWRREISEWQVLAQDR